MKLNRLIVVVLYAMAILMMVMPLGETLLSVWPVRAGDTAWRFGAAGLFSRALMTPLLGLVLLGILGYLLAHRRAVLATSVLAAVGALILLLAEGLFLLDAVQMRAQVRTEARLAFDLASTLAFVKIGTSMVLTALLAVGAWKMARQAGARPRATRSDGAASLVVGRHRHAEPTAVPPATSPTSPGPEA